MTARAQEEVRDTVMTLLAERRVETEITECLHRNATKLVVRRRH